MKIALQLAIILMACSCTTFQGSYPIQVKRGDGTVEVHEISIKFARMLSTAGVKLTKDPDTGMPVLEYSSSPEAQAQAELLKNLTRKAITP